MTSTHLLSNSDSRSLNQTVSNFSVDHVNNVDDYSPISVQTVQFSTMNLFNNVNEPYNVLYVANLDANTIEGPVTIAPGFYNSLQLKTALESALLITLGWSSSISISTVDFRFTLTNTGGPQPNRRFLTIAELRDSSKFNNPLVAAPPPLTLNYLVGVGKTEATSFPGTLPNVVNLSGPGQVYITSSALTHSTGMSSEQGHIDYLGHFDLGSAPYGSRLTTIINEQSHKTFRYTGDRSLSSTDFQLVDRFGNEMTLPENVNVFVEMIVNKNVSYH